MLLRGLLTFSTLIALIGVPSASAAPTSVTATGLHSPALPPSGCNIPQLLDFAGTVVHDNASLGSISFSGQSTGCATLTADNGWGWFSGTYSGYATYTRSGPAMTFTGYGFTLTCAFVTSVSPAREFGLECLTQHAPLPPGADVMTASGTISPGLPTTGCYSGQTLAFDYTIGRSLRIGFQGTSSICEDVQFGAGSGSMHGDFNGSLSYTRNRLLMEFSGLLDGPAADAYLILRCAFVPTSTNPVTTYLLTCVTEVTPA